MSDSKPKCKMCNRTIPASGAYRNNGGVEVQIKYYHSKCLKKKNEDKRFFTIMRSYGYELEK